MNIKQMDLHTHTHVMGILNITPDSFSDGGNYNTLEKAVEQALHMEAMGADIIDIGAESTRPNHIPVSAAEEVERVIPFVKAISECVSLPISIDTYKSATAEAALQAGASIINDVWGAKADPLMAHVAATYNVPIVLMHNRDNLHYTSLIEEMIQDLRESVAIAKQAGVRDENIILDPGIGFAKTLQDNYEVLKHLDVIKEAFPYPILLGASRKSFIGEVIPLPASERDNATGATTCFGIMKGAQIIRVHDVKRNVELAKMTDAMMRGAT